MKVISKRKSYITIQVATDTSDSQGGGEITWSDSFGEWARTVISNQSRVLDQGGIKYYKAVEFTVREGNSITNSNRIKWNDEYYTIHSVIPSGRLGEEIIIAYE